MSNELTQEAAIALAVKYAHFPEGKIPALVECWVDGNDIVQLIKDVYAEASEEGRARGFQEGWHRAINDNE